MGFREDFAWGTATSSYRACVCGFQKSTENSEGFCILVQRCDPGEWL